MGDPAGISAEITIKAWLSRLKKPIPPFIFFGSDDLLKRRAHQMGFNIETIKINNFDEFNLLMFQNYIPVFDIKIHDEFLGQYDKQNDDAIIKSIYTACRFLDSKKIGGIVTNPVNKNSLTFNKKNFKGQTELLAEFYKTKNQIMLLTSEKMKVIPLTRHIPITEVSNCINEKLIINTTLIAIEGLKRYFNIIRPRVAISGLNPHAGDSGLIGLEEIDVIKPAIKHLQTQSYNVLGPFPADSLFHESMIEKFDIIICMYHDQALIPIKASSLHSAVNVTLGLDIIRTSPDHGTAYNIARKFVADERSLIEALILADKMIKSDDRQP